MTFLTTDFLILFSVAKILPVDPNLTSRFSNGMSPGRFHCCSSRPHLSSLPDAQAAPPGSHRRGPGRWELGTTAQGMRFNQWVRRKKGSTDIRHQTSIAILYYFENRTKVLFN